MIKSSASSGASVATHLDEVLRRIEPYRERVAELAPDTELHVVCSTYTDKSVRVKFGQGLVADLSVLGAIFGLDVYFVQDGNDEVESTDTPDRDDGLYQDTEAFLSVVSASATREDVSSVIGTEGDSLAVGRTLVVEVGDPSPVWLVRSLLPKNVDLELHVDNVLQRSRKFARKVLEVSREHDVCVWCLVKTNDRIVLALDPVHVRGMARLGAGFGLDCLMSP